MPVRELVNLVADLRGEKFGAKALAKTMRAIAAAGFEIERVAPGEQRFFSWIDYEFGGTWSSEAFAGRSIVAKSGDRFAGFATFDSHGLKFSWLRGLGSQEGVGIFGPFGVGAEFRGSNLGPLLLVAALGSLREAGYAQALIPAVGSDKLIAYYEKHAGARVAERFDRSQWRDKRYRTVVLASGQGTNFQSVIDGVAAGALPLEITALVTNNPRAFALERARAANIPAVCLPWDRKTKLRPDYDAQLSEAVRRAEQDLVLLLGWMHLLDDRFIAEFPETINIHPAFLPLAEGKDEVVFPDGSSTPAFRGGRAVRDALAWGSRWSGATAHRITLHTDRGPVLVRKPLALNAGEGEEGILQRLHPLEHQVMAGAIMRWVYER
jgi:phosphoribosylglycinamide formyltransferase-1